MNDIERFKYELTQELKDEYRTKYLALKEIVWKEIHTNKTAMEQVMTIKKVIELIDEIEAQ